MGNYVRGVPRKFFPGPTYPRVGSMQPAYIMVPIRADLVAEVCRWQSVQPPPGSQKLDSSRFSPSSVYNSSFRSSASPPAREVRESGGSTDSEALTRADKRRAHNRERRRVWRDRRRASSLLASQLESALKSRSPSSGSESEKTKSVSSSPVVKLPPVVPGEAFVRTVADAAVQVNLGERRNSTGCGDSDSGDDHSPDLLANDLVLRVRSHLRSKVPGRLSGRTVVSTGEFLDAVRFELYSPELPKVYTTDAIVVRVAQRRLESLQGSVPRALCFNSSDLPMKIDKVIESVLPTSVVLTVLKSSKNSSVAGSKGASSSSG